MCTNKLFPIKFEHNYLINIINALREPLLILDCNLNIICANNSFYKLFRTNACNIENKNLYEIDNKIWDIPILKDKLNFSIKNNIEFQNLELQVYLNEKNLHSIQLNLTFINLSKHYNHFIVLSINDITQSKKAAEELAISESKYATLVEKGNDSIIIVQKKMLKFVNNKFLEITEYENNEVINSLLIDHVPIEFKRMLLNRYIKTLKTQHNIKYNYEVDFFKKNKEIIPTEVNFSFIYYENHPSVMVTIRDITERKKSEIELKNSEQKYSTLVEKSNDAIIILQNNYVVFVNNKFVEITEYSKTEAVGKLFSSFLSAESRRIYAKKLRKNWNITLDTLHKREIELLSKQGTKIPVIITASVIEHEGKSSLMAIIRDITEQKYKEQKLLKLIEVQKLLENAIESSPAIVFLLKPVENWPIEFVSENISQFGYDAQDIISQNKYFINIIHPSDIHKFNELMLKSLENEENNISIEYRILTKDGQIRWVDERAIIKRDKNNSIEFIQGIIVDITQRKTVNNFMHIGAEFGSLNIPISNINDFFKKSLELITQLEGIDSGMLYLVDEINGDLNLVEYTGLSTNFVNNNRHFSAKSLYARILKTEYPIYKLYSEIMYITQLNNSNLEKLEATAILPLKYKNDIVGVFLLYSHTEYSINENVRLILDDIVSQIGPSIGNMRQQSIIQRNIPNFDVLLDNIQEYIFVLDKNGYILYANKYLCSALEYSYVDLINMDILNLIPQKTTIQADEVFLKIISGSLSSATVSLKSYTGNILNMTINTKTDIWDNNLAILCFGRNKNE